VKCQEKFQQLIHNYLDGDLTQEDEIKLRTHLEDCETCQTHFHELSRTITLIQSTEQLQAPNNLVQDVMEKLPTEKRYIKYMRSIKRYPVLTAVAIFLLIIGSAIFSLWDQSSELVISKKDGLEINGDLVIVPKGVTIEGDLFVKNGDLKVEGSVEGDVTLMNGELIESQNNDDFKNGDLVATVGDINGELYHVEQLGDWIWYHLKNIFESIFLRWNHIQSPSCST